MKKPRTPGESRRLRLQRPGPARPGPHPQLPRLRSRPDSPGTTRSSNSSAIPSWAWSPPIFTMSSFPDRNEGELSKLKASATSTLALARLAREIKLDKVILLGRGEEKGGGRKKSLHPGRLLRSPGRGGLSRRRLRSRPALPRRPPRRRPEAGQMRRQLPSTIPSPPSRSFAKRRASPPPPTASFPKRGPPTTGPSPSRSASGTRSWPGRKGPRRRAPSRRPRRRSSKPSSAGRSRSFRPKPSSSKRRTWSCPELRPGPQAPIRTATGRSAGTF